MVDEKGRYGKGPDLERVPRFVVPTGRWHRPGAREERRGRREDTPRGRAEADGDRPIDVCKEPVVVQMRVRYQDAQQVLIRAIEHQPIGHDVRRVRWCIQWETQVDEQALAVLLNFDTATTNLLATAADAGSHAFVFSPDKRELRGHRGARNVGAGRDRWSGVRRSRRPATCAPDQSSAWCARAWRTRTGSRSQSAGRPGGPRTRSPVPTPP